MGNQLLLREGSLRRSVRQATRKVGDLIPMGVIPARYPTVFLKAPVVEVKSVVTTPAPLSVPDLKNSSPSKRSTLPGGERLRDNLCVSHRQTSWECVRRTAKASFSKNAKD